MHSMQLRQHMHLSNGLNCCATLPPESCGPTLAHTLACLLLTTMCMRSGSMGRTMTDLITLDGILRSSNMTSTAVGAIPEPVACAPRGDADIDLKGLRLGLPSNFGWVHPGLSSQVIAALLSDRL